MAFNQKTKERGNAMLDKLIKMTRAAAVEACQLGDTPDADPAYHVARDGLYRMLAKLYEAKAIGGGIVGPDVNTKAGSK